MTTWPHRLASAVRRAVLAQIGSPDPGGERGGREIDAWYARYPETADLVRAADMVVKGGTASQ